MKKGILLVAVGTRHPEARGAFANIAGIAGERFPDTEIRWAYTSLSIRRKLARNGETIDSPLLALGKMREEGFTHLAVQSLHIVAGADYHDLAKTVGMFRSGPNAFQKIVQGKPLLVTRDDLDAVVTATLSSLPERRKDDAVVLMGHGNRNGRGDFVFMAAAAAFAKAEPMAMLGTLKGHPTVRDVLEELKSKRTKRAFLVPFMSVAGAHARNDLAGDGDDSWKHAIVALGIECVPVLKGLAEIDDVVVVWMNHLSVAMGALSVTPLA